MGEFAPVKSLSKKTETERYITKLRHDLLLEDVRLIEVTINVELGSCSANN